MTARDKTRCNRFIGIDVKHVSFKNIHTGNYSVTDAFVSYFNELHSKDGYVPDHVTAFRLTDGTKLIDKFLCVYTADLFANVKFKQKNGYSLIAIDEVREKCSCYELARDY